MIKDKLYIDIETADRITTTVLEDHYYSIKNQINDPEEVATMHPGDLSYYIQFLPALKKVLEFYGRNVG